MRTRRRQFLSFLSVALLILLCTPDLTASEVDWTRVEGRTVKVFYPGVSSWDFVRGDNHGTGTAPVRTFKKTCADCHVGDSGEFDINANEIIAGTLKKSDSKDPFEPEPLVGMPGFKEVQIKVAYDEQNIYLWLQWEGSGASVTDPSLAENDKADKIAVQMNNNIKSFAMYGCFMTCHNDQNEMPENRGDDVTLYGYYTREKDGSIKSQSTLDGHLSKGQFVDLWVTEFAGTEIKATDEYILQKRAKDTHNDLSASGSYENGKYTAVITRELATGDQEDVELEHGKRFYIGIAVHDNKNSGRKHYVSFPLSIGLSGSADIAAQKL